MANWNALLPSQFKPSGFISKFRWLLGGRNFKPNVRMTDEVSSATQPPPDVPGGSHHKVYNNYYCTRDARHEVTPPLVVVENTSKHIENAKPPALESSTQSSKLPLPGNVYHWD